MNFIRSILKTTPPPGHAGPAPFAQPQPRDREALFWWIKRNTSYTAFAANAALWAEFVREFEVHVRSRDDAPTAKLEALELAFDTQRRYVRGLARLRVGDRRVFDRTSPEGCLARLEQGRIASRLDWTGAADVVAVRDGCPLSTAVRNYIADQAAAAVGDFSSYESMGHPRGAARRLLDALPFETALPERRRTSAFTPGQPAPGDGIYEMVDAAGYIVGGMRYFVDGQRSGEDEPLEFGADAGRRSSAFAWRLVWADMRYKDAVIPFEESMVPSPNQSASEAGGAAPSNLLRLPERPCAAQDATTCAEAFVTLWEWAAQQFVHQVERFIAIIGEQDVVHIDRLLELLGPNDQRDDFDRGRFMYEWNRPGLRLYVETRGDNLVQIDWLDPRDTSCTGTLLRTAWKRALQADD